MKYQPQSTKCHQNHIHSLLVSPGVIPTRDGGNLLVGDAVAAAFQGAGRILSTNTTVGSQILQGSIMLFSNLNETMFIAVPHCTSKQLHTLRRLLAGNSRGNSSNPV